MHEKKLICSIMPNGGCHGGVSILIATFDCIIISQLTFVCLFTKRQNLFTRVCTKQGGAFWLSETQKIIFVFYSLNNVLFILYFRNNYITVDNKIVNNQKILSSLYFKNTFIIIDRLLPITSQYILVIFYSFLGTIHGIGRSHWY